MSLQQSNDIQHVDGGQLSGDGQRRQSLIAVTEHITFSDRRAGRRAVPGVRRRRRLLEGTERQIDIQVGIVPTRVKTCFALFFVVLKQVLWFFGDHYCRIK